MDHASKALSRVYWQYRNSPKMLAWMQILPAIAQANIETPLDQIVNILNIDTAVGHQLDIIGRIAGISERPTVDSEDVGRFGYAGTPAAVGYGIGPYIGPDESIASYPAPDSLFRIIVRARIYKNVSLVTLDDVKAAVDFILDERSTVVDGQNMTIESIWLSRPLAPSIRKLVETQKLIPRPQGVKIASMEQWPVPEEYNEHAPEFVALMSEFDMAINSKWPSL